MNKLKRGFELTSAIIAIVIGGILAIAGVFVMFGGTFFMTFIEEIFKQQGQQLPTGGAEFLSGMMGFIGFLVVAYSALFIVLGSLLCKTPWRDNVYRERKGIKITLLIAFGLELLAIFTGDFLTFIFFAAPFGLLLTSMILKADNNVSEPQSFSSYNVKTDTNGTSNASGIDVKMDEITRLKNLGVLDDAQYDTAVKNLGKEVENIVSSSKTVDEKVRELKKLRAIEAITVEEYNDAVNQIIK